MPNEKEIVDFLSDVGPFIGVGAIGGLIRALNTKPFSWGQTLIRMITGGSLSAIALMYLYTTTYPLFVQGFLCGVIGIAGDDIIKAVRIRLYKEVAGEDDYDGETEQDNSHSGCNTDINNNRVEAESDEDSAPDPTCYTDDCNRQSCKGCEKK